MLKIPDDRRGPDLSMYARTSCRSDCKFGSCVPLRFLETASVSTKTNARNKNTKRNAKERNVVEFFFLKSVERARWGAFV